MPSASWKPSPGWKSKWRNSPTSSALSAPLLRTPSKATASPTSFSRGPKTLSKPCSAPVFLSSLSRILRALSRFLRRPALRRARKLSFLQDSCRLGGFPDLSELVWYNCLGSKFDLTQRAAASAATSYLECGSLLPLFPPFRRRQERHH